MKKIINKIAIFSALIIGANFGLLTTAAAQTVFQTQVMAVTLNGTSNLHDWEMKAVKGQSEIRFVMDASNKVTSLTKLSFTLPAKNLKSKHSAMDKNTYKALNTDKNPDISFVLTSSTVTTISSNKYQFNCIGKLTIAGVTKETTLKAIAIYNPADKTLNVTGTQKMNMTDYGVKPPTAMFGTIKTGNAITIAYDLKFKK